MKEELTRITIQQIPYEKNGNCPQKIHPLLPEEEM